MTDDFWYDNINGIGYHPACGSFTESQLVQAMQHLRGQHGGEPAETVDQLLNRKGWPQAVIFETIEKLKRGGR